MSQLITCPDCAKQLQVPENLLGQKVQCPECKHAFTAVLPEIEIAPAPSRPALTESKTPAWDKKKRRETEDDDEDRRKHREDDDDLPRRRRPPRYSPHRGGMILAFGIIGLVTFIPIFPILAWIMGNGDLREIRAGRMDPEGESMTNVGRILGMVATILMLVSVLGSCVLFGCIFFFGAMGAANANKGNFPQRRR